MSQQLIPLGRTRITIDIRQISDTLRETKGMSPKGGHNFVTVETHPHSPQLKPSAAPATPPRSASTKPPPGAPLQSKRMRRDRSRSRPGRTLDFGAHSPARKVRKISETALWAPRKAPRT